MVKREREREKNRDNQRERECVCVCVWKGGGTAIDVTIPLAQRNRHFTGIRSNFHTKVMLQLFEFKTKNAV